MNVDRRYRLIYKPAIFVASLVPLLLLVFGAVGLFGMDLGADPVREMLHTAGKTSLNLLLLTLLVTPVRNLMGWPHVARIRRMLGLFAFFYVALHFAIYLALDLQFDFPNLFGDILKRPYITIGFLALLMLIPLAITSTNRMMRRLGRRWVKLHRLIYPIVILGVWHYWWQVKIDIREPLIYAGMLAVLLGYRVVRSQRSRAKPAGAPVTSKSAPARAPERT